MNGQWYAEGSYCLTADSLCRELAERLLGSAHPSRLADQIREMLGEDCELEASILEEIWESGLAMTSARCRRSRNPTMKNDGDVTFAELNTLGSFSFSPVNELMSDHPAYVYPADSPNSYRAVWLHDPLEESTSRREDPAWAQNAAGYKQQTYDEGTLGAMTCQRACELLSVRDDSSATQIKAAYRRMVSKWHPDRLERSAESVRAFATKQMAAINEAYHLLREASPARADS